MTQIIIRATGKYTIKQIENDIDVDIYDFLKKLYIFENEYSNLEYLQDMFINLIQHIKKKKLHLKDDVFDNNIYIEKIIFKANIHNITNNKFFDEIHLQFNVFSSTNLKYVGEHEYEIVDFKIDNRSINIDHKINIYDAMCAIESFIYHYVN
jgi:hypothetical protein